ncbi:hypothetical protein ACFXP3_04560 [Streptomyces sp. NPDC059096]|uniref:hypothetical protein n=1 Tax=Streptomyces sp. NPDC059096 TaxID=3346727 RepID=UPI0036AF8A13
MTMQPTAQPAAQQSLQPAVLRIGDYVLYRDADRYWAGEPNHTFVCCVTRVIEVSHRMRFLDLVCLKTKCPVKDVSPDYLRFLPPADAMRDIDNAPLDDDTVLTSAAIAWLRQQYGKTTV